MSVVDERHEKILNELELVRSSINALHSRVNDIEKDIRTELKLTIMPITNEQSNYERRLSFAEKIIFGTAGFILIGVLGALMASILK